MTDVVRKILHFDRSLSILTVIIALILITSITLSFYKKNMEAENSSLKSQIVQMQSLTSDIIHLRGIVKSRENKIRRSNRGVVSVVEDILSNLKLVATSIKPLETKKINGNMEEMAELELSGTDLNSIVNLLYRLENSPVLIKINNASVKTTFEDPDKFILKISLSYIRKA